MERVVEGESITGVVQVTAQALFMFDLPSLIVRFSVLHPLMRTVNVNESSSSTIFSPASETMIEIFSMRHRSASRENLIH